MANTKSINEIFKSFIEECNAEDLNFIATNELNREEIITVLLKKNEDTKENILENFGVKYH